MPTGNLSGWVDGSPIQIPNLTSMQWLPWGKVALASFFNSTPKSLFYIWPYTVWDWAKHEKQSFFSLGGFWEVCSYTGKINNGITLAVPYLNKNVFFFSLCEIVTFLKNLYVKFITSFLVNLCVGHKRGHFITIFLQHENICKIVRKLINNLLFRQGWLSSHNQLTEPVWATDGAIIDLFKIWRTHLLWFHP